MLTAIPVITLIGETLLSGDFPARSGKQPVLSKTKNLTNTVFVIKRNVKHLGFSGRFDTAIIQFLKVESIAFTIKAKFQVHKSMIPGWFRVG